MNASFMEKRHACYFLMNAMQTEDESVSMLQNMPAMVDAALNNAIPSPSQIEMQQMLQAFWNEKMIHGFVLFIQHQNDVLILGSGTKGP